MTLQIDNYYTALYWLSTVLAGYQNVKNFGGDKPMSKLELLYLPKIGGVPVLTSLYVPAPLHRNYKLGAPWTFPIGIWRAINVNESWV